MTKRKEERRELLKEDEFLSLLERVAQYIQDQPRKVFGTTLVVFAVLALIFAGVSYSERVRDRRAQALYGAQKIIEPAQDDPAAEPKFENDTERFEAALVELDKVIANSSGSMKQQALINKAKVLVSLGRQEQLEGIYTSIADAGGPLAFLGHQALGDLYRSQGKYDDAMDRYSQMLRVGGMPDMQDLVEFKLAECLKGKGQVDQAKAKLGELIGRYEGQKDQPPVFTRAKNLLAEIDAESSATGKTEEAS